MLQIHHHLVAGLFILTATFMLKLSICSASPSVELRSYKGSFRQQLKAVQSKRTKNFKGEKLRNTKDKRNSINCSAGLKTTNVTELTSAPPLPMMSLPPNAASSRERSQSLPLSCSEAFLSFSSFHTINRRIEGKQRRTNGWKNLQDGTGTWGMQQESGVDRW